MQIRRAANDLPRPLWLFWVLNIVISSSCALIMLGNRLILKAHYPYTWPFIPFYRWIDFVCFQPRFQHFHRLDVFSNDPSFSFRFMYPAPMAVLYEGFYLLGEHSLGIFLCFTMALVALLAFLLGREMLRQATSLQTTVLFLVSAACFSYPFWFEYLLGNMEVCIFLMVAFGVLVFLRGHLILAAVLIGLAASMKIFPFVYLALFLSRRRYGAFACGIAVAIVANVCSLWLLCPSLAIAYRGVQSGLSAFRETYMLQYLPVETGFDHSVFGFIKSAHNHLHMGALPPSALTVYLAIASIGGVALYFLKIRHLPLLNQILCLCIASILLPPTSHDYTLIYLYLPWGLMVLYAIRAKRADISVRGLMLTFICFAILMSAESELIYKVGYSGQLKAIVLIVLLVNVLRNPWGALDSELTTAGRVAPWAPSDRSLLLPQRAI